jgi:RND family efflux transporter MFP subunit
MKPLICLFTFLPALFAFNPTCAAELPAIVHYAQLVELGVPVSGVVGKVFVGDGQAITQGTLMLELDDTPFLAEVDEAEASLKRLSAERDEARKALDRNLELYDRMVLSTVDLDTQKLQYVRAESQFQSAQARLSLAKYHFTNSKLHAPFDGVVLNTHAYPGMAVRVDLKPPVLFLYAKTGQFTAEADTTADRLGGIAIGDTVEVQVGDSRYPGRISNITLASEGRSTSQPSQYRVRALLDATGKNIMPGQPATLITRDGSKQ